MAPPGLREMLFRFPKALSFAFRRLAKGKVTIEAPHILALSGV